MASLRTDLEVCQIFFDMGLYRKEANERMSYSLDPENLWHPRNHNLICFGIEILCSTVSPSESKCSGGTSEWGVGKDAQVVYQSSYGVL